MAWQPCRRRAASKKTVIKRNGKASVTGQLKTIVAIIIYHRYSRKSGRSSEQGEGVQAKCAFVTLARRALKFRRYLSSYTRLG